MLQYENITIYEIYIKKKTGDVITGKYLTLNYHQWRALYL